MSKANTSPAPRRLAVIPARGGSKRLPGKNIRDFCGKPMLAHILETAGAANLYDAIHVSTEDAAITEVATRFGHPPAFARPTELADDITPLMPVLRHSLASFAERGRTFDQVHLLMACAPLLEASDLVAATELFESEGGSRSVIGVSQFPAPIEWAFRKAQTGALTPVQPGMFATRSQDLPMGFYDTGSFVIFSADNVRASTGAGADSSYLGFELPRWKAIDVDSADDWEFAELVFRGRRVERH